MQWFRDRKTMTKLMIGFGIMMAIMCVLGYEGIRNVVALNAATHYMYERHALGLSELKDSNIEILKTTRTLRTALLARDKNTAAQRIDELLKERESALAKFSTFEKDIVAESVRAKAAVALQRIQEAFHGQDRVIDEIRANQHDKALAALDALAPITAALDAGMAEVVSEEMEQMRKSAAEVDATAHSAETSTEVLILAALAAGLALGYTIARTITKPLGEMSAVLAKVAARDLTTHMDGDYRKGDFAIMKDSLNTAVTNLREALTEVRTSADSVASTAGALSSASEHISSGAQEQASSLEETASSLEQITATVKQNAESARQASQLSAGSRDAAEKGGQVVTSAVAAMTEINQASKRIADIITTIDEIAFQTNLLALNAAVEAARAGEQGRGFAVVAAEVRNLAQRSATAAKEIKALIQDSVRKVESGSELVNRSGHTLEEIVQSIKRVTDIVAEIAAASQEQSTGIEQVNKATMQMDQVTQSNASQTEEMASTAQGLSSGAEQLQALVGSFRLGTQAAAPSARIPAAAVRPAPVARKKVVPTRHAGAPQGSRAAEGANGNQPALAALALHTGASEDEFEEF